MIHLIQTTQKTTVFVLDETKKWRLETMLVLARMTRNDGIITKSKRNRRKRTQRRCSIEPRTETAKEVKYQQQQQHDDAHSERYYIYNQHATHQKECPAGQCQQDDQHGSLSDRFEGIHEIECTFE